MNKLPFLQEHGWPKLRKYSGESKYGFSEEDEIIEQALNELMQAVDSKDHSKLVKAIKALVDCIMARESEHYDAFDSQQEAGGL